MYATRLTRQLPVASQIAAASPPLRLPNTPLLALFADAVTSVGNRSVIPNDVAVTPPVPLVNNRGRRGFAVCGSGNLTVEDCVATAPDGSNDASRLTATGANWYWWKTFDFPAGTYTFACNVKRGVSTDQHFKIGANWGVFSDLKTATASWQRFSFTHTFTDPSPNSHPCLMNDAEQSTLLVCDFEWYEGTQDLGPAVPAGHCYLGSDMYTNVPPCSGGELDMASSTTTIGSLSLPSIKTSKSFTALACCMKVDETGPPGSSWHPFLARNMLTSTQELYFCVDINGVANDFSPMGQAYAKILTNGLQGGHCGLWQLFDAYTVVAYRNNGDTGKGDWWLDDLPMLPFLADLSVASPIVCDEFDIGQYFGGSGSKFNSIILYDRFLSDAEMRQAVSYLRMRALKSSLLLRAQEGILLFACGDSLTAGYGSDGSYADRFGPNSICPLYGINWGMTGSSLNDWDGTNDPDLPDQIDSYLLGSRKGKTNILTMMIGTNDLPAPGEAADAWLARYASWCDDRRAAGWLVAIGTLTPNKNYPNFNEHRNYANPILRTWVGVHVDAVFDFAADPVMGPDDACDNPVLYFSGDKMHITNYGYTLLEPIYRQIINAASGVVLPNTPFSSAGVFDSDNVLVRTLWSTATNHPQVGNPQWDGTLENGEVAPTGNYTIKVLQHNVQYEWDGVIGNTSNPDDYDTLLYHNWASPMCGLAITSAGEMYFTTGYSERWVVVQVATTANPQVSRPCAPNTFRTTYGTSVHVVSDGTRTYFDMMAGNTDSLVFGISTTDGTENYLCKKTFYDFEYGDSTPNWFGGHTAVLLHVNTPGGSYQYAVSGLGVQQGASGYLFVSRGNNNEILTLNKVTGQTLQDNTTGFTNPGLMAVNPVSGEPWLVNGATPIISKLAVDGSGNLTTTGVSISGITPAALAISPDGTTLLVADKATHQVRAFNTSNGSVKIGWNGEAADLLMHGNGTDGSQTITDECGHTVTVVGDAQIDTDQSKFGGSSIYFPAFPANSNYLKLDGSSDFAYGTGDFTLDFWFRKIAGPSASRIIDFAGESGSSGALVVKQNWADPYRYLSIDIVGVASDVIIGTTNIELDTWYHVALTCSGGSMRLFLNGVQEGSTYTNTTSFTVGTNGPFVGIATGYGYWFAGHIQEIHSVKGTAKWTSNFTPPAAPYVLGGTFGVAGGYENSPDVTNTKFMFRATAWNLGYTDACLAFASDGSWWLGDTGNARVLHFSAGNSPTYVEQISWIPMFYACRVVRNDETRVLAQWLEFEVDYSKELSPTNGSWTLSKNWFGNVVDGTEWQIYTTGSLKYATKASNGKTYATVRTSSWGQQLVEMSSTGLRYMWPGGGSTTGIFPNTCYVDEDCSLWKRSQAANVATLVKNPRTGWDGSDWPIWEYEYNPNFYGDTELTSETLPSTFPSDNSISLGCGYVEPTENNGVLWYNNDSYIPGDTSFHLGSVDATSGKLKFMNFPVVPQNWGNGACPNVVFYMLYPEAPYFPTNGGLGNYGGGGLYFIPGDSNIFVGFAGENYGNNQANVWSHFHDSGLLLGRWGRAAPYAGPRQYLTTAQVASMQPDTPGNDKWPHIDSSALSPWPSASPYSFKGLPGMAGNAFYGGVSKVNGKYYLYQNDEWYYAGVHRWSISNTDSIHILSQFVPWDENDYVPPSDPSDLLLGLPYNSTVPDNTAGWHRYPVADDTTNWAGGPWWKVQTNAIICDRHRSPDIVMQPVNMTGAWLARDFPAGAGDWTLSGTTWINPGSVASPSTVYDVIYIDILDNTGKIILRWYIGGVVGVDNNLWVNDTAIAAFHAATDDAGYVNLLTEITQDLRDFSISADVSEGTMDFSYHTFSVTGVTVYEVGADISSPGLLKMSSVFNPTASSGEARVVFSELKYVREQLFGDLALALREDGSFALREDGGLELRE